MKIVVVYIYKLELICLLCKKNTTENLKSVVNIFQQLLQIIIHAITICTNLSRRYGPCQIYDRYYQYRILNPL
ncbi:hypothetical protein V1477_007081 [Vespula maculifrons]|uniref:Uncharacterized protein n=1 Tax=Vespula maculifrons TaxID=7453 RepID=A0ABD2CIK7_VESMC